MQIFSKPFKLLFHDSHFRQMLSGIISSQPYMTWHKPWRSLLPCKRNWHANPRGSYIEHITESMPRFVIGWSFKSILSLLHHSQHPRKSPILFKLEDYQLNPCLLHHRSALGIWSNISFLLLMNFVNVNPPFLHRTLTCWISVRASITDGTGFSTSST